MHGLVSVRPAPSAVRASVAMVYDHDIVARDDGRRAQRTINFECMSLENSDFSGNSTMIGFDSGFVAHVV